MRALCSLLDNHFDPPTGHIHWMADHVRSGEDPSTTRSLTQSLGVDHDRKSVNPAMSDSDTTDVAIIGMACRFPGARNPGEFWALLREGREARSDFSDDDLRAVGVPEELLRNPNYVKAGMVLNQMEQFDPGFFGFSPLDGRILDPQHRHFLECTWEALEDAAYDPFRFAGAIGVFAGSGYNAYLAHNLLTNSQLVSEVGFFLLRHTGNDKDFLATRVSYCFDLRGPSVSVQSACSTSLVAIHYAAQSLINAECDMALAGGVTIELPHRHGYLFKDSEILSRDGHCRPFDASAGGTVFGSGVGVVVLKRLRDAIADGDNIQAVIRASAVNNDGAGKISYLAPSVDGQAAVVAEALAIADVHPTSVSYIATHGTGTQLGDPIEIAALTQAYGEGNPERQYCGIGSVKANIGHTDTAAGVASLISVVLAMNHRELPPTIHFQAPNAAIDFPSTPFFVCDTPRSWASPSPLRAGVSSLGVGGTNAHLILEEAPTATSGEPTRPEQLLLLSARSEPALLRSVDRLAQFIDRRVASSATLADAAYTLAVGRRAFRRRAFAVVSDPTDALRVLEGAERERLVQADAPHSSRRVAFMFAGGGAQYPTMGRGLYESEPIYRTAIDECLTQLGSFVDYDLKPLLFPADETERLAAEPALERPSRTIPALFVTQYAQARLWQSWGIVPAALIGHSMGENTAAALAGVFSLRDAIGLVALRGRLFESVGEGSMLSVDLDESALLPLLGPDLSIAAVNAPGLAVASGPKAALRALETKLTEQGIGHRRIRIDVAAHSSMLDPILVRFGDYLRSIRLNEPTIPFISNRTGTWITSSEARSPDYWVAHLRRTVRFSEGVEELLKAGDYVLVEVGPGRTLSSLANAHTSKPAGQAILASMRSADDATPDLRHMLGALGRIWQSGVEPDWQRFYAEQARRRISMPTYPFEHVRCWVDPGSTSLDTTGLGPDAAEKGASLDDWLYQCVWERSTIALDRSFENARALVLAGEHPFKDELLTALKGRGADTHLVRIGAKLDLTPGDTRVRCAVADDFVHLIGALSKSDWIPTHVVNLLPLELPLELPPARPHDDRQRVLSRTLAFDGMFNLIQAIANEDWQSLRWLTLTQQAFQVAGEEIFSVHAALTLGPMRVLPREFPSWQTRLVDVATTHSAPVLAQQVSAELADPIPWSDEQRVIAWRGQARFVQNFAKQPQPPRSTDLEVIRARGTYLITGGLGGLGLEAAYALAAVAPITLVLVNRRTLPESRYWPALIEQQAPESDVLRRIDELSNLGARVILEVADVADRASVRALAARLAPLGKIDGILHTAGVVEDAPILDKDLEQCARVFAAKVDGTLNLDEVFDARSLDFFALYSSTSSFHGLPGQIDYASANAFLDAFAFQRSAEGANVLAINWPAWRSVGMAAANADGRAARRLPPGRPLTQPLLQRVLEQSPERSAFATLFSVADFWLLEEHRIKDGPSLVPGSGFLELARAAFVESRPEHSGAIEIRDASFDLPFVVGDDEHRLMRIDLAGDEFNLSSESYGDRVDHARGRIGVGRPLDQKIDLSAVRARCDRGIQRFSDPDHHPFLSFGERWQSLKAVHIGEREALIELCMEDRFVDELADFPIHPALCDMATAGAQVIMDGYRPREDLYVPIGCKRFQLDGTFGKRAFSHVRHRTDDAGAHAHDIARFDVRVCDETGRVFMQVDEFTMRRVGDPNSLKSLGPRSGRRQHPVLERTLELGIEPDQGRSALLHVLSGVGPPIPQTIVSPYRLGFVGRELLRVALPEPIVERTTHDPDIDPEISPIAAKLVECPAIESVIVRSFRDASGERRLVAYLIPAHEHFTTLGEVRRFARAHLPGEQLPEQFVELDEWPIDSSGAIDRAALSDPLAPVDTYLAPRTSTEKTLARIWQDVLGVERVGLADNFFDLGGHSLLSTRVIVQVFKRTGVRLDQPTMVLNTLEQVAREVDQRIPTEPAAAPSATCSTPDEGEGTRKPRGLIRSLLGRR